MKKHNKIEQALLLIKSAYGKAKVRGEAQIINTERREVHNYEKI